MQDTTLMPLRRRPPRAPYKLGKLALCNGSTIKKHQPKRYAKALEMLCDPAFNFADITRKTRLSYPMLRAILEHEKVPIEQQKEILKRQYIRTLRRLTDRVEDTADQMKPRDAIFGISVVQDKLNVLTGSPTSTNLNFNVNASVDLVASFNKLHQAIEERLKAKELNDSHTIDVSPIGDETRPETDRQNAS